uniref:Uncharacterized protein n=1 Tax=Chaetoceros debilis TaxID=122233 RepID=A0A7S3Q9V5_9STRA
MTSFGMPTGPKSDLAELLYVAALHQTSYPELRIDGSFSASDIVLYLRSRYGIKIDDGTARDIVHGLGGTCGQRLSRKREDSIGMLSGHSDVSKDSQQQFHGNDESPNSINNQKEIIEENYLDMVQWVSTLLIPSVVRSTDASCYSAELNARVQKIVQELRTVEDTSGGSKMHFIRRIISRRFWQQELQKLETELLLEVNSHLIPLAYDILAASLNVGKKENKESNSLTTQSLSGLLLHYGEIDASNDKDLLSDMINCVDISHTWDQDRLYFNEAFFMAAITHDILGYDRRVEDKLSTPFFDVFHCDPSEVNGFVEPGDSASNEGISLESSFSVASGSASYPRSSIHSTDQETSQQEVRNEEESPVASMDYISSAPYIDYAVDCQRGIMFSQFMWIYFIFLAVFYVIIITHKKFDIFHCDPGFLCKLGNRLWTWMSLGIMLSCGGVALMVPISFVNDPYKLCFRKSSVSILFTLIFTVVPYHFITDFINDIPHGPNNQFTDMDSIMSHKLFKLATQGFLSFGILMMVSSVLYLAGNCLLRENRQDRLPFLRYCNCRETTCSLGTKHAATHKVNNLLDNAMATHESSIDTENLSRKFLTNNEKTCICGGVMWTWKQIFKRNRLLHEHGIWLPSRLAVGQLGQIIVFALIILLLLHEKDLIIKDIESIIATAAQEKHGPLKTLVLKYTPKGWIIESSFNTGIGFAAVIGIILMLVYIPSTVATTLKLRSGMLPSMLDVQFHKYRYSADTTTYNVGEFTNLHFSNYNTI